MSQNDFSDTESILSSVPTATETDPGDTQSVFEPTAAARASVPQLGGRPKRLIGEKRKATQSQLTAYRVISVFSFKKRVLILVAIVFTRFCIISHLCLNLSSTFSSFYTFYTFYTYTTDDFAWFRC
jgi:hypothetical protein